MRARRQRSCQRSRSVHQSAKDLRPIAPESTGAAGMECLLRQWPANNSLYDILGHRPGRARQPRRDRQFDGPHPACGQNGIKYYFQVAAKNLAGEGKLSAEVWAIPLGVPSRSRTSAPRPRTVASSSHGTCRPTRGARAKLSYHLTRSTPMDGSSSLAMWSGRGPT